MNKTIFMVAAFISTLICITPVQADSKNEFTIYQVMQRVLDRYPSLKISEMEVSQAAEQKQQVESSLGWILNSSAGIKHDLTGLGTPSDRLDISGSIGRQLKSGATLSLSGGYTYEDSSLTFSPSFPNPAHTTRLDLNYRLPLSQGVDNPQYAQGIISADANYDLIKANQLLTRITLAEKVKDLFYSSLLTYAQLLNSEQAVQRARKLSVYVNKNVKLGLSENKDKLQVRAQLDSKLADLSAIQLQWKQQQTSINRLMLEDWDLDIRPVLVTSMSTKNYNIYNLIKKRKPIIQQLKYLKLNCNLQKVKFTRPETAKG